MRDPQWLPELQMWGCGPVLERLFRLLTAGKTTRAPADSLPQQPAAGGGGLPQLFVLLRGGREFATDHIRPEQQVCGPAWWKTA